VYLPLALADAPSRVTVTGGTHVPLSPCFHYLSLSWRPFLTRAGLSLSLEMERAGFYPPGGGIIHARIEPSRSLRALRLERRGRLLGIRGLSAIANLPEHVAERQRERALHGLGEQGAPCRVEIEHLRAPSKGSLLLLLADFEHTQACFFALGAPGKPAEQVADEALAELLEFLASDSPVEPHMADQLLLPLACAAGRSVLRTSRITDHQVTNAAIIREFLPVDLEIEGKPGESGIIRVCGKE
jgi:RNA 3'-terminal phosphate cyclase (ATP)